MRRREKFILAAVALSLLFFVVQMSPLSWRFVAVTIFALLTYTLASWALSDDLSQNERITIVPFPAFYAAAVGLFYVVLPQHWLSRFVLVTLFAIGMYAIFLTCNILSVAKGRSIQLLYAAQASQLFFTLLISLLLVNTIFSFHLPFFLTVPLVGLSHFFLIYMSLWSTRLNPHFEALEWKLTALLTFMLMNITLGLSFFPLSVWQYALLVMSVLYLGLGIMQNYLRGRLFSRTLREYAVVTVFTIAMFFLMVPLK